MSVDSVFASEVAEYLTRTPRQLPSKYFYDALGSALFEAICLLPWYRITRAEDALLQRHAAAILSGDGPLTITELGCGSGDKLGTLIEHGGREVDAVHLVDVSAAALMMASRRLESLPIQRVASHRQPYIDGLREAVAQLGAAPVVVLFLGSNIGNFDPPADHALLVAIRECLRPGDAVVLGTDLIKPESDLLRAYDDPLQVTAAFNRNLLRRINDELGGTFDLDSFAHRAVWNPVDSRVEMHLISARAQVVRIAACDLEIAFQAGEAIWTESSYKYRPPQVVDMGARAGLAATGQWLDDDAGFAVTRFVLRG